MNFTDALWWQTVIDNFHHRLCRLVSWFTLLMVIITCLVVILRYGFNLGWIAMQESVMYLHAGAFLLGAAHTLRANEHVRVDIFYRRFSPPRQAWVDIGGTLILMLPVNFLILFMSWEYVESAWRVLESSPEAGGLPLVFVLKSLLLLFAFTMSLQGIAELLRNILLLRHGKSR